MPLVSDARAIAEAGIRAVRPAVAVRRVVRRIDGGLRVGERRLAPGPGGRLHLVALGKAAGPMIDAAAALVGRDAVGLAAAPRGYPAPRRGLPIVFGDHPVPRAGSLRAGAALLRYVGATVPADAVLFLLSGGGSATAESPVPPLSGADVARATEVLLDCGAPIGDLNAIRRHLSELKGGRLALATRATHRATVAISDVVGDPPADIASGPTVADPSTFSEALAIVRRYRLDARLPVRVVRHLEEGAAGRWPETPKARELPSRAVPYVFAATNRTALEGARACAQRRGYRTRLLSARLVGETQPVARRFVAALLREARRASGRVCLLAGGETTVTLGAHPPPGGRNQEFALTAVPLLAGRDAVVLSVGTDGIDGPTDAAGGWATGTSRDVAGRRGVSVEDALRRHAAYPALARLGSLLKTGPTGTNVMDLHVGLAVSRADGRTGGSSRRRAAPSNRRRPT
ncbi:MAG TPA: DUF4147 domain-containing protein [Thermoplasmata archaeon]|nr:DUF4147 domain-containing protein [Thermoplasmata archaeon]